MKPFDYQPQLKGELIELRPLRPDDFDALFAVSADPLLWEQHPVWDRYKEDVFRELFKESLDSGGALVVIDRKTGELIGSSRFFAYSEEMREVEIGWSFLARAYWGGKYNGEMKRLMLVHAFQFVDQVLFIVGCDNLRSQKAMEKLGAQQVGTRPDTGGNDSYIYQIKRSEYLV